MARMKIPLFVTAAVAALPSAAWSQTAAPLSTPAPVVSAPSAPVPSVPDNYRLDTDDTVLIDVARHPDVARSVRIPADGTIRLPRLLHPVPARGKTCAELSDLLAERLVSEGKLVMHPGQVTVSVVGLRVRRIFIRGSAVGGHVYDLKNDDRISEVVAVIGGITQPERLTALVTGPLRPAPVPVSLDAALNTPGSPENIPLLEGDTLTIDSPKRIRVFVEGEGPRGMREFDNRYGLKQMLIEIGFTANGATGDLKKARIRRKVDPLDPGSADTFLPVDLLRVMNDDSYDVKMQDMDTLQIPVSEQFIYVFGEINGPRKVYLPQDRKWYLSDVVASSGGTGPQAKIGAINIIRSSAGKPAAKTYDFGKYLKNLDAAQNPEMQAGDLIYVPNVKRPDVGSVWTTFGLFNIFRTLFPGVPGSF